MTDQRDRVITDPGIGPVEFDNPSTLRSMAVADEVLVADSLGGPVYYEPKQLNAISDHKTIEIETVKLSQDIDPRKLPTELSIQRPPLVPQFDSGWPPADLVLTSSQRPMAPRRRWRVPVVLFALLGALLLLVLARSMAWRAGVDGAAANGAVPMTTVLPAKPAPPVLVIGPSSSSAALLPAASTVPVLSAAPSPSATQIASDPSAASSSRHGSVTVGPQPSAHISTLSTPSAAPVAKPKRAIY